MKISSLAVVAAFAALILSSPGLAPAAPPQDLGHLPTFEQEVRDALAAAEKAAAEAARDPDREFLQAYVEEKSHDHSKIVDMIADAANDRRNKGLREDARDAIVRRFGANRGVDPSAAKEHKTQKLDVSDLLAALLTPRYARRANELAYDALKDLWSFGPRAYKTDGTKREKAKWAESWKKFLKDQR